MRTAIDVVLDGVSNGSINHEDAKILLEAINQKGFTSFIPITNEQINPNSSPYRPGDVWYTTNTTSDNKSDING